MKAKYKFTALLNKKQAFISINTGSDANMGL